MRKHTQSRNRLSDRDILLDIMNTEKYISMLYEKAITESTTQPVYKAFRAFQDDQHENARTLFTLMQERGWYKPHFYAVEFNEKSNLTENFNMRQDSRYALTSGSKNFGGRLRRRTTEGPKSKSGIFTKTRDVDNRLWQ